MRVRERFRYWRNHLLRKTWLLGIPAVLALAIFIGAACDDDDEQGNGKDLSSLQEQQNKTGVLAAMNGYDLIGLHEIDEEMQTASEIPEGVPSDIEKAHQITVGTAWPDELKEGADTLETALADLMAALEGEDLQTAKGLATDSHEAWHELSHEAYAYYAGEEHEE